MRTPGYYAIGIALISSSVLSAQTAPAFEVASVKPSSPTTRIIGLFTHPGGRITATLYSLDMLMAEAFDVQEFQISGGPSWVRDSRWDIEAKPPASSKSSKSNPSNSKLPPNPEQRAMLRSLLAERFHLQIHRQTKEAPVYALMKSEKELKLEPTKDPDGFPWAGSIAGGGLSGDGIRGENCSMEELARRLSGRLGRVVLDRTGITGSFDFRYVRPADPARAEGVAVDNVSGIFEAVKGIGLKLEASKGQIEVLVIDHVEKPAEN